MALGRPLGSEPAPSFRLLSRSWAVSTLESCEFPGRLIRFFPLVKRRPQSRHQNPLRSKTREWHPSAQHHPPDRAQSRWPAAVFGAVQLQESCSWYLVASLFILTSLGPHVRYTGEKLV